MSLTFSMNKSSNSYDHYIRTLPILSIEEERKLAIDYKENNNLEAAQSLVLHNLRFVSYVVRKYRGYKLPDEDLMQEGTIGLMKAVKRFNPYTGVRLSSFAVFIIKNEIINYVLNNWKLVKIVTTKPQKKLFFNLRKYKKEFETLTDEEIHKIAKDLRVPERDVIEMEKRLFSKDVSYDLVDMTDAPDMSDNIELRARSSVSSFEHLLIDTESDPANLLELEDDEDIKKMWIKKSLSILDSREKEIIKKRWLQEKQVPFRVFATKYNVSVERIRQVEAQALKKMRDNIEKLS